MIHLAFRKNAHGIIPYIMENKIHVPNHQPDDVLWRLSVWISFSQAENALNDNFKCSDSVDKIHETQLVSIGDHEPL